MVSTAAQLLGATAAIEALLPECDVSFDREVRIAAPAPVAFEAMCGADIERSAIVRGLFRIRQFLLGGRHARYELPHGLLEQLDSLGWRCVAEEPGRYFVFAAVTQPWKATPVFRGLCAQEFARFAEPGYAKIAFTLEIRPLAPGRCIARTETRVATTDPVSRIRFRWYWSLLSPGIELIRAVLLAQIKAESEQRLA